MLRVGWEWSLAFMPYGQWWRRHRRAFWQHYNPAVIPTYYEDLERGAHRLLSRLLARPETLNEHLR